MSTTEDDIASMMPGYAPPLQNVPGQPQAAPPPQPQGSPAQPAQDPMLAGMMSLRPQKIPDYQPPDTSGLDSQIAQGKQAAQGAETELESADKSKADLATGEVSELQRQQSAISDLFQKYPARQVFYGTAMQAAPIIGILAALGGKAAGLSGTAMLGALNGMAQGINEGSEENFKAALDKWKEQLQEYRERNEQQQQMYKVMLDAYSSRADAAQKARDFALTMTNDAFDQKQMAVKDSMNIWDMRTKQIEEAQRMTAVFDEMHLREQELKLKQQQAAGPADPTVKALDGALSTAGVQIPGMGRGGQLYWQKLADVVAANPGKSPEELVQMVRSNQLSLRGAQTETTVAGRKEASVGSAMEAMNQTGGIWDQVDQAAKKVDFGSSKTANDLRLAAQGKAVANPDIQAYVTTIEEARAELSQIYARSGQTTDAARRMAEDALPLAASYEELQAAKKAAMKASQSVLSGNQRYMQQVGGGGGPQPQQPPQSGGRTVVRTGVDQATGRKVVQYSDGSVAFAQ